MDTELMVSRVSFQRTKMFYQIERGAVLFSFISLNLFLPVSFGADVEPRASNILDR